MEPKVLFAYNAAIAADTQITAGPATGKKWIITTLYICNIGAITGTITLEQGYPTSANYYKLLNTASLAQGETVNVGSIVMEYLNVLKYTAVGVAFDIIAYGYEDDEV
jgi:hypothetical protein